MPGSVSTHFFDGEGSEVAVSLADRESAIADALAAVISIADEAERARTLAVLGQIISSTLTDKALSAARAISDPEGRARALAALASNLPAPEREAVLLEALASTRTIVDDLKREFTLANFLPVLADTLTDDARAAAESFSDPAQRARLLVSLALHVSEVKRSAVLPALLNAAREISSEKIRTEILVPVVHLLPEDERDTVLRGEQLLLRAELDTAHAIADEELRSLSLAALAAQLTETEREAVLTEALNAARAINQYQREKRIRALTTVALYLPDAERERVLREALAVLSDVYDNNELANLFDKIAPCLPQNLAEDAIQSVQYLQDKRSLARILEKLVPRVPSKERESVLRKALAAARAVHDASGCARILANLSSYLPAHERESALREALAAARSVSDHGERARALVEVARSLPETPHFAQTFSTRVFPKASHLPELVFISISRDTDIHFFEGLAELKAELEHGANEPDGVSWTLRGFSTGGTEILIGALVWHLRSATQGSLSFSDAYNYNEIALQIVNYAELPVKSSPLKGITLGALVGGGSATLLDLARPGVSLEEALVSVLVIAGTIVIFGASKGVARGLEAGLEQKILEKLGVGGQRRVAAKRKIDNNARANQQRQKALASDVLREPAAERAETRAVRQGR
jgi:hypothetical protein